MRLLLLSLLASLGVSVQAMAGQVPPNMIYDCERPQLAALSKELGRAVCVQYDMIQNMNVVGPAVEAAARASVSHPIGIKASADPSAIICREHDVAFRTPTLVCARNSDWNPHLSAAAFPKGAFPESGPFYYLLFQQRGYRAAFTLICTRNPSPEDIGQPLALVARLGR